jgi:hypothetical protein
MTRDNVWHVRGGYSFPLDSLKFIEPVVMYARFEGDAASMTYPNGIDHQLDIGVNWYIRKIRSRCRRIMSARTAAQNRCIPRDQAAVAR